MNSMNSAVNTAAKVLNFAVKTAASKKPPSLHRTIHDTGASMRGE
jgi:hypothetical protein